MVIMKIMGGLGNQMFQYATGKHLAILNNTELKLDLNWFEYKHKMSTPRNYELNNFPIKAELVTNSENKKLLPFGYSYNPILKRLSGYTGLLNKRTYYPEKSISFDAQVLKLNNDIYMEGYWNSFKYFENIRELILEDYSFDYIKNENDSILLNEIKTTNSVSVHFRRGDYVQNKRNRLIFHILNEDYYSRAMSKISEIIINPKFFIFSDDINWVKENIEFSEETIFIDEKYSRSSISDMKLMSICKHNIIANSTYSWWAAWLNQNEGKKVIAPNKWFKQKSFVMDDLIPFSWLKL